MRRMASHSCIVYHANEITQLGIVGLVILRRHNGQANIADTVFGLSQLGLLSVWHIDDLWESCKHSRLGSTSVLAYTHLRRCIFHSDSQHDIELPLIF